MEVVDVTDLHMYRDSRFHIGAGWTFKSGPRVCTSAL